jgi:hypothetical protein
MEVELKKEVKRELIVKLKEGEAKQIRDFFFWLEFQTIPDQFHAVENLYELLDNHLCTEEIPHSEFVNMKLSW